MFKRGKMAESDNIKERGVMNSKLDIYPKKYSSIEIFEIEKKI